MDAREKWLKQAMQLASIFLFEGRRNDDATPMLKQAGDHLQAHIRTTPEGFALVPVDRLEQLEKFVPTVSEYIDNYLQDERDEVDCCVCGEEQQHRLQSVFQLRDRLESSKAPPPKSEPL